MKPRTIIGIIFIVASLLKLATIWGFIHWSWFAQVTEQPWTTYFCIFVVLYVGVNLIIEVTVVIQTSGSNARYPSARTASASVARYTMVATSTSITARRSMVRASMLSVVAFAWTCARL